MDIVRVRVTPSDILENSMSNAEVDPEYEDNTELYLGDDAKSGPEDPKLDLSPHRIRIVRKKQ